MIPDGKDPKDYDDYGHRLDIESPAEALERVNKRAIAERDAIIKALLADFYSFYELEALDETRFVEREAVKAAMAVTGWKRGGNE